MASVLELKNTLEELLKEDLKHFQWHLSNIKDRIPAPKLENADVLDTVNKMREQYGTEKAVKVTMEILRKMKQNELAEQLENKHKEGKTKSFISCKSNDSDYSELSNRLKESLKRHYEQILDGDSQTGHLKRLDDIYTDLFIVKNETGGAVSEHEVRQIELNHNRTPAEDTPIKCNDIFKGQCDQRNRKVLTMGIAGVGKTVSVNKFILDWAEGKENQEIIFVFPLPFYDLNLIEEECSLMDLIHKHFNCVVPPSLPEGEGKVMFIFDGLDEYRFPLTIKKSKILTDVHKKTTVGDIITNLITRNLLPSALIWITSRPAAAHQIPREYIDQVTEVRGFNDEQKEKYFTKNSNPDVAKKIISHMKKSRSLYIMCHIPVFCRNSLSVFQPLLTQEDHEKIPTTLTGMYIYFLLTQIKQMTEKYSDDLKSIEDVILKLGELAFKQLQKGNLIFNKKDLEECGLVVSEGLVYSGLCTQIFQTEKPVSGINVYSFVHLSVQEFLAALYVLIIYKDVKTNPFLLTRGEKLKWKLKNSLIDLHKTAIKNALQSKNGHLDLLLRFLMGLSLKSNQNELKEFLPKLKITDEDENMRETADYIKMNIKKTKSAEKSINLFYCLNELKDNSLITEIQTYLNSGNLRAQKLSSVQWSALAFVLLMSEETQETFELGKYGRSDEAMIRLLPVIKNTKRADLSLCWVTAAGFCDLASALRSNPSSHLRELNLSHNNPGVSGVKQISDLLKDPHCTLEKLNLCGCKVTDEGFCDLASALRSNPSSHLRELNLSRNDPGVSGVKQISDLLKDPHCTLEKLDLCGCKVTDEGFCVLASALRSNPSSNLRELNLSRNILEVSGVKQISDLLKDPQCTLETLDLCGCKVTDEGFCDLASALRSNPSSHLRELNLSQNNPGVSGVKQISDLLKDPHCTLEKLNLCRCGVTAEGLCYLASALRSNPSSHLRELNLSFNDLGVSGVKQISDLLKDPHCTLEKLDLCQCEVTAAGFCDLASALRSNPSSHLRELNLSDNHPGVSGVKQISDLLKDPHCTLETLHLSLCGVTAAGFCDLASALRSNPSSHLRELNLSDNDPGVSGVKQFSDLLKDPHCTLEKLKYAPEKTGAGCCHRIPKYKLEPPS
ncbi:NACHT, LRR and PYD domains-containing protein 12-like [Misgurnus anguillicaudatus]|uniref:NACHT, LRR and PYD domains-containing protein 12-like n=1 Tax=Misgurnus anguillicaudatus TaxID=75329 RepID=UPI003CCF21A5